MSHITLDIRLHHWAAWMYSFENNLQGWPEESSLYKFLREGFLRNENAARTSSLPYKPNKEAEEINSIFNQLKEKNIKHAQAIYVYYVSGIKIKKFVKMKRIHLATFYRHLRDGKQWIGDRISL